MTYNGSQVKGYWNGSEVFSVNKSGDLEGGSAPILTNAITWISVTTDYWRDAFSNKIGLIATHSGGNGNSFLSTLIFAYPAIFIYKSLPTWSSSR